MTINEPKAKEKQKPKPHQVQHAAQHGQQEEGCLRTHVVNGTHHCGTRGWNPKDKRPDGVQVKLY